MTTPMTAPGQRDRIAETLRNHQPSGRRTWPRQCRCGQDITVEHQADVVLALFDTETVYGLGGHVLQLRYLSPWEVS